MLKRGNSYWVQTVFLGEKMSVLLNLKCHTRNSIKIAVDLLFLGMTFTHAIALGAPEQPQAESCQVYSAPATGIAFPLFRSLAYAAPARIADCVISLCTDVSFPNSVPTVQVGCRAVFLDNQGQPLLSPGAGFFAPSYQMISAKKTDAETQGGMHFFRVNLQTAISEHAMLLTQGNFQIIFGETIPHQKTEIGLLELSIEQKVHFDRPMTESERKELEKTANPNLYEKNFPEIREHLKLTEQDLIMGLAFHAGLFQFEKVMNRAQYNEFLKSRRYLPIPAFR